MGSLQHTTVQESRITNYASRVDAIDALLPQTQCSKCGYPGCRPYAEAIARGEAGINQCPPGGAQAIRKLAELLGRAFEPLNPAHGSEEARTAALIDEADCIGCTLCIRACPVDAIVGAAKQMHSVLIAQCTGCGLCLPPCPVDCIQIVSLEELGRRGSGEAQAQATVPVALHAARWRARYHWHQLRVPRRREEAAARPAASDEQKPPALADLQPQPDPAGKRAAIQAALARARARRTRLPR